MSEQAASPAPQIQLAASPNLSAYFNSDFISIYRSLCKFSQCSENDEPYEQPEIFLLLLNVRLESLELQPSFKSAHFTDKFRQLGFTLQCSSNFYAHLCSNQLQDTKTIDHWATRHMTWILRTLGYQICENTNFYGSKKHLCLCNTCQSTQYR